MMPVIRPVLLVALVGAAVAAGLQFVSPNESASTASLPSQVAVASGRRLLPEDGATGDATFAALKTRLAEAAAQRDSAFVESVLDPQVQVGFGPDDRGLVAFRTRWRPADPASRLWPALQAVVRVPASRVADTFWMPYVFADWPGEFDPYTHAAVISDNAVLRERAGADGPALARLSFHIVRLLDATREDDQWQRVATTTGVEGYVASSHLLRPNGLRLQCTRANGGWRIAVLLEGD
jgi:hypothetical protein